MVVVVASELSVTSLPSPPTYEILKRPPAASTMAPSANPANVPLTDELGSTMAAITKLSPTLGRNPLTRLTASVAPFTTS